MREDVHSRSRLAGYNPELLFNNRVLIVGAGALGQNLALDLALAGVGEINIVDFDIFEAHNATRSPLYPTVEEQERWGKEKAKVVAHKLLPLMTAHSPKIRYAVAPVQALGDLPMLHAQLVFAAVDNQNARAYLAERCHVAQRPLIEAGFYAERFNVTIFGPGMDDPCYRCFSPGKEGAYSCTRYALLVESQHALPAIQNTAAVLAGLQAETGIQWLHGKRALLSKRIYGNIHEMTLMNAQVTRSSSCPGIHWQDVSLSPTVLDVGGNDSLESLLKAVEKEVGFAQIRFPQDFVVRNYCTKCNCLVDAYVPEWGWLASSHCVHCGGSFSLTKENHISSRVGVYTDENEADIINLTCAQVGLPAGTICEIWPEANRMQLGERYLMRMRGTIDDLMEEVNIHTLHSQT